MDYARRYSDEQMEELRRQLEEIYGQAATEVEQKLEGFNRAFARKSQQHLADVEAGEWTQAQYQQWLLGQVFQGKQWKQKLSDITGVYTKADKIARQIIGTGNLSIFAEAANYTAFNIEQNTGIGIAFNLYDRSTVKRLLLDHPQMLPEWKIDEPKDYVWNEKRVRNAVTQGIIQGESVPDIGKRLCRELATSNGRKMELFARTAITGAENAGRVARMEEAQDMGITVQKQWIATLDSRTRDAHQDLDGQIQDPDKPFKSALGDIRFPGDPSADPANLYNCRCTLGYYYPEYKPQNVRRRAYNDPESRESEVIDYVTYSEWKEQKKTLAEPAGVQHAEEEKPRPIHADFTPAQSIQEAEEYARQFVSGSVSYRGLSLDAANACNRALADIQATYGIDKLGTVQPMNMRSNLFKNSTADAAYRWGMRDLFINPKYYKNAATFTQHMKEIDGLMQTVLGGAQNLLDSGRVTGAKRTYIEALLNTGRQCVSQSHDFVLGTFIHENGHRLDDGIFRKAIRETFGASNITYQEMLSESRKTFGGGISGYAVADNQEYIAESFTAWWFGEGDKCDPRIVSVFEGLIKK